MEESPYHADIVYDAGPTGCGELIMNLFLTMKKMSPQQIIEVVSYDPGARQDIPAWCRLQGQTLLGRIDRGNINHYYIQKNKS